MSGLLYHRSARIQVAFATERGLVISVLVCYDKKVKFNGSCGCDEIGRHVGFRFQCEAVQVQVLSSAPNSTNPEALNQSARGSGFVIF